MRRARCTSACLLFVSAQLAACSDAVDRDVDDAGARLDVGMSLDGSTFDAADGARDATHPPDARVELDAPAVDTGPPMIRCGADDARAVPCAASCDGPSRWYWNGDACFAIDCGACEGSDCASRGLSSEAECVAAHATCRSAQCESTGGTWMWWAEECGDYVCGRAPPADCESGRPACDCGPFRSFDPTRGCFDDRDCPIPEPVTRQELCTGTGGTWASICCDTECGVPCAAACAADACDCGPGRIFDEARGCMDGARCHERRVGETCTGVARCDNGAICCQDCGGAGCFGDPTCRLPTCDDDPSFDACGNCVTCP